MFLVLRLRSVLGKRVGFEKPPAAPGQMPGFGAGPVAGGPIIDGQALPVKGGRPVPDPHSALGERLMRIVNADQISTRRNSSKVLKPRSAPS